MGCSASAEQTPPPPKAWETGAWAGLFCDPYADGVLSAGEVSASAVSLSELLGGLAKSLTLWDAASLAQLDPLRDSLAKTGRLASFAAKQLKDADGLAQLVGYWGEELRSLSMQGDDGYALVPCGWKDGLGKDNHCVLVVERVGAVADKPPPLPAPAAEAAALKATGGSGGGCSGATNKEASPPSEPTMRVTLVNVGEGANIYHPASLGDAPTAKVRRKAALLLGELPLSRATDPAFLATLLSQRRDHETHKVEVLYDALLPWLADRPTLVEALAMGCPGDQAADWRTMARSKTSGWRSLMEACRYILRRRGVGQGPLKQLALQLRRALFAKARRELRVMAEPSGLRSPTFVLGLLQQFRDGLVPGGRRSAGQRSGLDGSEEVVGLYFSAHWCPPCRQFTPRLAETYARVCQERGRRDSAAAGACAGAGSVERTVGGGSGVVGGFEVVFVSRDRDQASFDHYLAEMPWLSLPFGDTVVEELVDTFEVSGIPTLVLVSAEGELLNMNGRGAVEKDPTAANFPWRAPADAEGCCGGGRAAGGDGGRSTISPSDRVLLGFASRQLARAALKEQSSGRLSGEELAEIEEEILQNDQLAAKLERLGREELPQAVLPRLSASRRPIGGFTLLCGTGEDRFRGQRVTPPPPELANMLDLPQRCEVDCFSAILDAMKRCIRITDRLLARARETGGGAGATSSSRLAIQTQVISFVQAVFVEVLPVPLPPGEASTGRCPWTVHPVTREQQLRACMHINRLMHLLGEMWQDLEEPGRLAECARATAAACAYAMFDVTIRQIASDSPMEISAMLSEGGGLALSTGVGRKRDLDFERASERLELLSPTLARARAEAVAYFVALRTACADKIFDMPIMMGGEVGLIIELEKYGSTVSFLLALLDRCGYPVIPEGKRPPTEMDSVMMWFGSHEEQDSAHAQLTKEHPEWQLLRDTCTLFKFLYSMLPLTKENMLVRKETQAYRGQLPLSFSPGAGRTGGRMESMPTVFWDTVNVRGAHHHIADVVAYSFYHRKLTWGEGATLRSPADVGRLLERQRPSEEDILHTPASQLKRARFDGTLSAEEAEALLTCLVAPYVRVPLVAHFFADLQNEPAAGDALRCGNRASFLFNDRLQAVFQAAILEQGTLVAEESKGTVVRVPMRRTARQNEEYRQLLQGDARRQAEAVTLGAPNGLLLNELKCSPEGTLRPLIELLRYTQEVSHCSLHSTAATFTLFMLSVGVFVELFGLEAREELESAGVRLDPLLDELGGLLRGQVLTVLERWIDEASKEVSSDGKRVGNLPTLAVLHAHHALLWAPRVAGSIDAAAVSAFLGSLAYVRGHHCFGQQLRNAELSAEEHADPELLEKKLINQLSFFLQSQGFEASNLDPSHLRTFLTGAPIWFVHDGVCLKVPLAGLSERSQGFKAPPAEVPEMAIADALQLLRRPLVAWLEALPQCDLDGVLSGVVRSALGSAHSVPATGYQKTAFHPGLYSAPTAGIIVDAQAGEILYQSEELRPVPDSMASFSDFEFVFGRESLQCAFRYTHEHRRWVDIIGEEHELLEWDAPAIDAQGVGAPVPLPGVVFRDQSVAGPSAEDVSAALAALTVAGHDGGTMPATEACRGADVIGIYFSAHWCPPCRGFTPKLGATYTKLAEEKPGKFEVLFVSSDHAEPEFQEYFASMPFRLAVPYGDGASRKNLGEVFAVRGIPSLCLVTPAGHVVSMDGRTKVMEDPRGEQFPWGSLEAPPAPEAGTESEKEDAITYCGVRYNRPFVWYYPGKVFPSPAPEPEPSEVWAVQALQPVLEALFPICPPDKKLSYVLYMPEDPLPAASDELVLIGMADEAQRFATWKEVRVHRQWEVVHCYNLVSHGRRMFRTLVWSSHGACCLHSLKPMHLKPACCPVPSVILDASGDWRAKRLPDPSLVIVRQNHTIGGRETFLPPRLLVGVVPGAFLDAHAFWQTEDLTIRGYPKNDKDEWFPYALEIALRGDGAQVVRCDPARLSKLVAKAVPREVVRRERDTQGPGPCSPKSATSPRGLGGSTPTPSDQAPLPMPVLSRNKSATSRLAPLVDLGLTEEQAQNALDATRGPDGRERYDLAIAALHGDDIDIEGGAEGGEASALLPGGGPEGTSGAVAGDVAAPGGPPALDRAKSSRGGVAGSGLMTSDGPGRQPDAGLGDLVLLDLFQSPRDSALHRLARALARIEDLGHVLAWAGATVDAAQQAHRIAIIELPRLKLRFQPRMMADGTVRVCSLDHDGWFLSDMDFGVAGGEAGGGPSVGGDGSRAATLATAGPQPLERMHHLTALLQGIPHSLLLENSTKELQLLVPAWELRRPKEQGAPFGTHLIFNRSSEAWREVFSNTRCFLYPVHATRAFLMPRSLDALLYLVLLYFYARAYGTAHRWATSVAVDVPFGATEHWVFRQFFQVRDGHPDAHALRLRLLIAVRFSEDAQCLDGWEAHEELDAYLRKVPHVTAGCALTLQEEMQAIRILKETTQLIKLRKRTLEAVLGASPTFELVAPEIQVGGEPWYKMISSSKEVFEERDWLTRFKFAFPAEEGGVVLCDAEALAPIFENLLIDDDESGSTRQLGFIFLYALSIGQISMEVCARQCAGSMSSLLTRLLQLKLAHWGKSATGTEVPAKFSKQCAVLALVFDHPNAGWPRLPLPGSDVSTPGDMRTTFTCDEIEQGVRLLGEGLDISARLDIDPDAEEQDAPTRGMMALWGWHVDLKEVVRKVMNTKLTDVNRLARRHIFKTRRDMVEAWICAPKSMHACLYAAECEAPFTPSNLACDSNRIRPFQLDIVPPGIPFEFADGVDLSLTANCLNLFSEMPLGNVAGRALLEVDRPPRDGLPKAALPFPVAKHPAAAAAIATDMLVRLEQDLDRYKQQRVRDLLLRSLQRKDLDMICEGGEESLLSASQMLDRLECSLKTSHETGMRYVENAVGLAVAWARCVPNDNVDPLSRCRFRLRQHGGLVLEPTYEALIVTSLCTKSFEEVTRFNPFVHAPLELMQLVVASQLHANRLAHAARTLSGVAVVRQHLVVMKQAGKAVSPAQALKLRHSVGALTEQLGARRFCLRLDGEVDPRLLVFEFLSSYLLRERQVEMVCDLRSRAQRGLSSCQQMLMGAGKTTVVGPLLVLCLADGSTAVLQTMPSALLEMTRNVLRGVFAYPLAKQVFTLTFDRTQDKIEAVNSIIEKLDIARMHRGVVVASPDSMKSLTLKMVEMLHSLDEHGGVRRADAVRSSCGGRGAKERLDALQEMVARSELADACSRVLALWKQGVAIMDEVDVLLHPLRSELNFPIGEKYPIDLSGERWELPIYLLSLLFVDELRAELEWEGEMQAVAWRDAEARAGETRADVLASVAEALARGVERFSFQTNPHLVLMDAKFYADELATISARYCLLWVHHLSPDLRPDIATNTALIEYITGASDLAATAVAALRAETMKMLNLAADWVQSYLPHCLSRIDRVSYGLLSESDKQPASAPESRRLMAVPFLAKDVPSLNSEFAHPDIVIGFTILAYRHEGLRTEDLHRIIKQMKGDFARQIGPRSGRPSNSLFELWKAEARDAWARGAAGSMPGPAPGLLSLELFQPEDAMQMANLHRLMTKRPQVAHHYLAQMVFPETMNFHRLKVSACGHELGSDMIFSRRIGFSGTPSNLLPEDLAPCSYEPGSDGKIVEVLTNPVVVSCADVPAGWSARSLLSQVAATEPPFHALIDTGALVTGLDSAEVAELLLQELPAWFEGVVFLDKGDRQMVLMRSSGRSCPLQQCGLPLDRRFTFYDQIHTTGMDIKQAPNARAALTIGKDMVFRDYAQGAWRMRGIGAGQTVNLMIIPEVRNRIKQDLQTVEGLFQEGHWEINVPAWLLINSMLSEGLQAVQLNLQELHNIYRKRALNVLQDDAIVHRSSEDLEKRTARFTAGDARARRLRVAIQVFRERISNDLETGVPKPKSFGEVIDEHVAVYDELGAEEHLGLSDADVVRMGLVRERATGGSVEQTKAVRGGLDSTRTQQQEREQQQQQMKEREQEEEQMSQFMRDQEQPLPWPALVLTRCPSSKIEAAFVEASDSGIEFPFSSLVVGDEAFYPMALFHACTSQPQLPFPRNILFSSNYFRPAWAGLGDRRLKNISLIIDWQPSKDRRLLVVPSLAEAETIRRLIHNGEYGVYDTEGLLVERRPLPKTLALAVRTLAGHRLDTTPAFIEGAACGVLDDSEAEFVSGLQCLRFFHGEMFFSDAELALLMRSLSAAEPGDRQRFFEECLRRRRRERREWCDTSVARIFVGEAEWATLRPRAIVEQARSSITATLGYVTKKQLELTKLEEVAIAALTGGDEGLAEQHQNRIAQATMEIAGYPQDLRAAFDTFDADEDGLLSRAELANFLKAFGVHPTASDVAGVMEMLEQGRNTLRFEAFRVAFGPKDYSEANDGAYDDAALAASLGPWMCKTCMLTNPHENTMCVYCQEQPRPDLECVLGPAGPPAGKWRCGVCTVFNDDQEQFCFICGSAKGAVAGAAEFE